MIRPAELIQRKRDGQELDGNKKDPAPVTKVPNPPQADELDFLAGNQLGVGPPPNYGFPNCYIQYAYGGVPGVPVGSGCVQPVVAVQPVVDASGTHELEGPTQVALAPSSFPTR